MGGGLLPDANGEWVRYEDTVVKHATIPLFKVVMHPSAAFAAAQVINSGYIGQGPKVDEFESKLGDFLGNRILVTTNSGTSALHLALLLLTKPEENFPGLQPGDEVLSAPLTCTASNFPSIISGYRIKWVDSDPSTLNMSLEDLEQKFSATAKVAIIPLWGGMPLVFEHLKEVLNRAEQRLGFRPKVIIDAAHGFGSTYMGEHISNFGHMAMYSFQAIKHLTSVDGGALVMPPKYLERARLLRWYGISRSVEGRKDFRCEQDINEVGTKWHMNDVNAAVGITNLEHIQPILEAHRSNAHYYNSQLANVNGVQLLTPTQDSNSSYWIYTMLVDRRDDFMKMMNSKGIVTSKVHERNDKHSALAQFKTPLPMTDSVNDRMVCIPVGSWVSSEDRSYIVKSIKEGW